MKGGKKMKGISAIMATIILLLITIAMAATAYMFIMGYFTRRMDVMLEPVPESMSCDISDAVYVFIRNVGTTSVPNARITVLKDGTAITGTWDSTNLDPNTPVKFSSTCTTNVCKFQFIPSTGQGTTVSIYCP